MGQPGQVCRSAGSEEGWYYAPELNPIEMIWQYLRRNKLAHRIYDTYDAIVDACCKAWNWLIATPDIITARQWANVSA